VKVALIDWYPDGHHAPYARSIAQGLRRAGHACAVVGPPAWCAELADAGESLVLDWNPSNSGSYRRRQAQAREFLDRAFAACAAARVDVAHVLYLDGSILALVRAHVPAGLAVLATQHWYPFVGLRSRGWRLVLKGLLSAAGLWSLDQRGRALVVHSPLATQSLRRLGLRQAHCIEYPNSIAADGAHSRSLTRRALGIDPTTKLLICFGGTRHDKGVDLAIAALAGTPSDIQLLVAGLAQDFDQPALLALAARHGVSDRVVLRLGHVPDAEVAMLFAAADALLLPYRPMFAGQSGPLVIAGSIGLPVIAADLPILSRTIAEYSLGLSFEAGSAEALRRCLIAPWPQIQPAATRRFAAASDPEHFAAQHVALYEGSRAASAKTSPAMRAS
jgi:glycosyltransferase involved in cell wall biosynthesis